MPVNLAESLTTHGYWRLLMLAGAVPALMTLFIRLLVPESEKWTREKEAGAASHWSERDLIGVAIGAAAACGVIVLWGPVGWLTITDQTFDKLRSTHVPEAVIVELKPLKDAVLSRTDLTDKISEQLKDTEREKFQKAIVNNAELVPLSLWIRIPASILGLLIVIVGYLMPAWGYLGRSTLSHGERRDTLLRMLLAAGLSGVALLGTWAGLMWMYQWIGKLPNLEKERIPEAKAILQIISSVSAATGCVLAAALGGRLGRRPVYAALCILSLVSMVGFYQLNTEYGPAFLISGGILSFFSAAFYGWLPLYLPELFRTSVRATGQGFGFNFGRIIAAAGNLQMSNLLALFGGDYAKACAIVAGVYLTGLVLICFAPETKGKPLPE
jgi:hypothetical protein